MTEGNFDAMVYLEEQGHPDLIMASYHDWLQYYMVQERRFNNWYPAANRADYWPPPTPERVSDPSTTLPSDDIANGGGGRADFQNPSQTKSNQAHGGNDLAKEYASAVNLEMTMESGGYARYRPRASQAPLDTLDSDPRVEPLEYSDMIFKIMQLQGQIPFALVGDDEPAARESNAWIYLSTDRNPYFTERRGK